MSTATTKTSENKLSLSAATIININMMLGSGIFVNTIILGSILRGAAPFAYLLVGLLIFPLIYVFQKLLSTYPNATFYNLGATMHPFVGFLSGWSYFFAKLASCSLGIHACMTLLKIVLPPMQNISTLYLDAVVVCIFMYLNLFNMKIGKNIQYTFIVLKTIPILFAVCSLFFTFSLDAITLDNLPLLCIPSVIPFILFAMTGFEASCSLSASIENSQKNGPKAVRYSFIIVLVTLFLYQMSFFMAFGKDIVAIDGFQNAFPALVTKLFLSIAIQNFFKIILVSGMAVSALGASYGILYSNVWNMYGLAKSGHTFLQKLFTHKNKQGIPAACMLLQGCFILFYTFYFQNTQKYLQQMNACGLILAYSMSTLAFFALSKRTHDYSYLWSVLAFSSCGILITTLVRNACEYGLSSYIVFILFLCFGIVMYLLTAKSKHIKT
jgi:amino acid transporter